MSSKINKAINICLAIAFVFLAVCFVIVSTYTIIDGAIPIRRAQSPSLFFFVGVVFPFSLPCFSAVVLFFSKKKRLLPMIFGIASIVLGIIMSINCLVGLPETIETKTSETCLSAAILTGSIRIINYSHFNFILFSLLVVEVLRFSLTKTKNSKKSLIITIYSLVGIHFFAHIIVNFFNSFNSMTIAVFGSFFLVASIPAVFAVLIYLAATNKRQNSVKENGTGT